MKKYATISLFIFWATVTAVSAAGLVSYNKNGGQAVVGSDTGAVAGQLQNITGVSPSVATLTLSTAELAKHDSAQSCWLLISGKIYDVTSFMNQHPGNASTILPTCGTDATVAYNSKGGEGSSHSGTANSMLADYYVGNLNQVLKIGSQPSSKTTAGKAGQTNTPTQTKTTPVIVPVPTATTQTQTPAVPQVSQTSLALTSAELVKHNSSASCWTLVSGKIYDLTSYINRHPGGSGTILSLCGADGTSAFVAQHGSSSAAQSALASLYIGDLNQTVITSPSNPTTPVIANPTFVPATSGRGDDDDDDD